MDEILLEVEKLRNMIVDSDEYKKFELCGKILDSDKEINEIINNIKRKQKIIINKEHKNVGKDKEEFEVQNLFRQLEGYTEYNDYIKSAKELNILITKIQKRFEDYFNKFVI